METARGYKRKRGDRTRVVVVACTNCAAPLERYHSRVLRAKWFFCSKSCEAGWKATQTGSLAARWAGGTNNRGPAAKARKARYRERHREEIRKKNAEYHAANPEMKSRYRKINRDKWLPKATRWAQERRTRELGAEGSYTDGEWSAIRKRFRNICPACGRRCVPSVDHIIPLSKGGTNYAWNLQPLCRSCNSRKHAKLIICFLPWAGEPYACESPEKSFWTLTQVKSLNTTGMNTPDQ